VQAVDVANPAENEPVGQSPLTDPKPEVTQCLPAGQGVQADELAPPDENDPGEHSPLAAVSPEALQNAPASQGRHDLWPVRF
jgi:hypothetical protein